ncbi:MULTISPECIES: NAD(P)/FAD-dependent oxidoreductase [Pacificibacter]|uniref:NAD(P)/FAD-dependent oxidoreductase n=1 Tax=Pacificibacter TaxID=1042323 RepID=UPI001C081532|nr:MULTISPECIES: FAD-dependent oxidoreductase [Pacificibacter]MBU2936451.1 FAD-dependent oxidoreductase [Pacificibacter marinus]MDO6616579.1 FAD-dependent oxidoreductase [Pacificibacter sp. 1_MG-2023]
MKNVVVIGAGQAANAFAFKLRALGHKGAITLIGDEPALPYQRPPLSKAYLLGDMSRERLFLRPQSSYDEADITVRMGTTVTSIDPKTQQVYLGDEGIAYDELVLTTGSAPIRLPSQIGGDLQGVFCVRTLADIDAMAPYFTENRRVLIVGGGYIGLEAAAVAAKRGLHVTVVEMAERILQRVAAPQTSDYFRALHHSHGVTLREGVGLSQLNGDDHVTQAVLSTGEILDVDFVIAGIGIRPNTALAEAAGVQIENGISTDAFGATSDPHIWAAGDCASFPIGDTRVRLESVPNAIDQAEIIAQNIMGAGVTYHAKPWFWSDQYDVKLQIAGLNTGYDTVVTRVGDKPHSVSHWYYCGETFLAVDAMNAPRDYMIGKRLIEAGKSPASDVITNPDTVLKSLLS